MPVKFCPLASGSSGNSVYIATENTHILIDAGLSGKSIENGLKSVGSTSSLIDAIFVTHEHSDHIAGIGVLSRKHNIPIYATEKTWKQIDKIRNIGIIGEHNKKTVYIQENCIINDIIINPFPIPHDSAAPVGYCIFAQNAKLSVATDIGHVTECIKESIVDSDAILIEANHDVDMLINGRYPEHLKKRVLGQNGHLSNVCSGRLIAEIMSNRLRYVFLGHLSEENNDPAVAYETVSSILAANKINIEKHVSLMLAQRFTASQMVTI